MITVWTPSGEHVFTRGDVKYLYEGKVLTVEENGKSVFWASWPWSVEFG